MKIKDLLMNVFIGVLILFIPFGVGKINNIYKATIGLESKNVDREVFEQTKSYIHGKVEDLQRYKRELEGTKDVIERRTLIALIQDEFSNFDENKIDNGNLRTFLIDIRNGNIQ